MERNGKGSGGNIEAKEIDKMEGKSERMDRKIKLNEKLTSGSKTIMPRQIKRMSTSLVSPELAGGIFTTVPPGKNRKYLQF